MAGFGEAKQAQILEIQFSSVQFSSVQFSSVQSLSHVQLFVTTWTAACQASLSITNSRNLLKLMSIELVMPSNHLILCCALLLLPSILPSIRVFSVLCIRWPRYWSFSFSISPSSEFWRLSMCFFLCFYHVGVMKSLLPSFLPPSPHSLPSYFLLSFLFLKKHQFLSKQIYTITSGNYTESLIT